MNSPASVVTTARISPVRSVLTLTIAPPTKALLASHTADDPAIALGRSKRGQQGKQQRHDHPSKHSLILHSARPEVSGAQNRQDERREGR